MKNKYKTHKSPSLFVNNLYVLNFKEKCKLSTQFFSQQCKPGITGSVLPNIEQIPIENVDIISLIRKLNHLPLRIIFSNIVTTANINNYNQSFLPICGKTFENVIFTNLCNHLTAHHLITKQQSKFRRGDYTRNQLIDLVNEIHHAFDNTKSMEVPAVFLNISRAFDKVWHYG